mgnify:CR=1 FL=1
MKINTVFLYLAKIVMPALVLSAFVVFSIAPVACTAQGITIVSEGCTPPALTDFSTADSTSLSLSFDREVLLLHALVSDETGRGLGVSHPEGQGKDLRLALAEKTKPGISYTFTGDVQDEGGSTLTLSITFPGYNDDMAHLQLAEVRNAYSSKKNHYEFVKLFCLTGGNLAGYELLSAGDGEQKKYVFPPITVAAGDFVTVHLRMMKNADGDYCQQGMVDEVLGDRQASFAADSSEDAWDLWLDNQKSRLSPSDILVLRDAVSGRIVDALPFADPKKEESSWNKNYEALCRAVEESGVWQGADGTASCDIADAFQATGITSSATSRTLCRRTIGNEADGNPQNCSSAADWYVKNYAKRK